MIRSNGDWRGYSDAGGSLLDVVGAPNARPALLRAARDEHCRDASVATIDPKPPASEGDVDDDVLAVRRVLVSPLESSRGICAPCHLFAPLVDEPRVAGQPLLSRDQQPSGEAAPGDDPEGSGPAGDLLSPAGDGGDSDPIAGTP